MMQMDDQNAQIKMKPDIHLQIISIYLTIPLIFNI